MKKLKKITATLAISFLLFGITNISAEDNNSTENTQNQKILTMRVIEAMNGTHSFITIVNENGKVEEIELDKLHRNRTTTENLIKINKTLNQITDKGYKLAFTSGGGDQFVLVSTYTFIK